MSARTNQIIVASHLIPKSPGLPMRFGPTSLSSAPGAPAMPLEVVNKAYVDAGDSAVRAYVDSVAAGASSEEYLESCVAPVRDELTQTVSDDIPFRFPDDTNPEPDIGYMRYTKQGNVLHIHMLSYSCLLPPETTRVVLKPTNEGQDSLLPASCTPLVVNNTCYTDTSAYTPPLIVSVIPVGVADAGCVSISKQDGTSFAGDLSFTYLHITTELHQ